MWSSLLLPVAGTEMAGAVRVLFGNSANEHRSKQGGEAAELNQTPTVSDRAAWDQRGRHRLDVMQGVGDTIECSADCSGHSCPNAMSSMSIATITLVVSMRPAGSLAWIRCRVGTVMPSTETKPSNRWAAGAPATISTS